MIHFAEHSLILIGRHLSFRPASYSMLHARRNVRSKRYRQQIRKQQPNRFSGVCGRTVNDRCSPSMQLAWMDGTSEIRRTKMANAIQDPKKVNYNHFNFSNVSNYRLLRCVVEVSTNKIGFRTKLGRFRFCNSRTRWCDFIQFSYIRAHQHLQQVNRSAFHWRFSLESETDNPCSMYEHLFDQRVYLTCIRCQPAAHFEFMQHWTATASWCPQ